MDEISEEFSGTQEIREQHKFEIANLQAYMEAHVDGFSGQVEVEQFKGGQSCPTYKLSAGGKQYVLRRKPPGKLLPSAHAVDREFKVISALYDTDVPVARAYALSDDESIVGTMFYIMEFMDGRVLWDQSLPTIAKADRLAYYDELNRTLAALHSVDYQAVGLDDFGKPGNYVARQLNRWTKQYRASETETIPAMDNLIEWLATTIPGDEKVSVVHGDYRLDNVMFHAHEPRIVAVLDWEISTLGDPLADFSYHLMSWRLGGENFRGLADYNLADLGIPSESAYAEAYCKRMGYDSIGNIDWYMVYNMWRMAAILQGIAKRAIDGTASSPQAVEQGKRARPLAEMAWALAEEKLL
jgi:aminoglycoside phosphotransferase (APT) family kinase protein